MRTNIQLSPFVSSLIRSFAVASAATIALLAGMLVGYMALLSTEWGAILGGLALATAVALIPCTGGLQVSRILMFSAGFSLAGAGMTDLLNFPKSNSDVLPGFAIGMAAGLLLAKKLWGAGFNTRLWVTSTILRPYGAMASLFWAALSIAILYFWDDSWTEYWFGKGVGFVLAGSVALTIQLLHLKNNGARLTRTSKWIVGIVAILLYVFLVVAIPDAFSLGDVTGLILFVASLIGLVYWLRRYMKSQSAPKAAPKLISRQHAIQLSFIVPAAFLTFYYTQALMGLEDNVSPTDWVASGSAPFKPSNENFIRLMMNDIYYWKPNNQAVVNTPEQFVENMAVDKWSFAETAEERDDWEVGIKNSRGVRTVKQAGKRIIAFIDRLSPAARAGYKRGDTFDHHAIKPEKHEVDEIHFRVIRQEGVNIGYLWILDFSNAAIGKLDDAFYEFKRAGVNEIIVDLRYNGGGHASTKLENLIAGTGREGMVIWRHLYSDKYQDKNSDVYFSADEVSLPIRQAFVLTTKQTCSASEQLINSLRPYISVITIGERTCGKPYFMDVAEYNGIAYSPVVGKLVNSQGKADFEDGIKPDCEVAEDFTHPVGLPGDTLLDTALYFQKHKVCPSARLQK